MLTQGHNPKQFWGSLVSIKANIWRLSIDSGRILCSLVHTYIHTYYFYCASHWYALQEALYKFIDTIQCINLVQRNILHLLILKLTRRFQPVHGYFNGKLARMQCVIHNGPWTK